MQKPVLYFLIILFVPVYGLANISTQPDMQPSAIPGIYKTHQQSQTVYTDEAQSAFLQASLIDMGGESSGLGENLSINQVAENMGKKINGVTPDRVSATHLRGIYELFYGGQVIYVDGTGRFIFQNGKMLLADGDNTTETAKTSAKMLQAQKNRIVLDSIEPNEMLVYRSKDEQSRITVFTDLNCPFCERIHNDLDTYRENGVTVEYVFFPRAGENSESFAVFESIWCDTEPYAAFQKSRMGYSLSRKQCDNPVAKHLAVAKKMKLTGTPVIALENGKLVFGYHDPNKIIQWSRDNQRITKN